MGKLKNLAKDAIVVPSTFELCARKSDELVAAREKLAKLVERQLALESGSNRVARDIQPIAAAKAEARDLVQRLERESGVLKEKLRAESPPEKLTPEQVRAQLTVHVGLPGTGATPEQLAEARAIVDGLVAQYHRTKINDPLGAERQIPAIEAAKVELDILEGPPYPARRLELVKEALKGKK
jgi:hypothetical protein